MTRGLGEINKHNTYLRLILNIVYIDLNNMKVVRHPAATPRGATRTWIDELEDEDLSFIKRFILASGSLKELATVYDISYPTVRLRLDRLIEKIKLLDRHDIASPFERLLRVHHAEGKIDRHTLKVLLEAYEADAEPKGSSGGSR